MIAAFMLAAALAGPPSSLPAQVYRARRERLLAELGGCAALLAAQGTPEGPRGAYRQDGDFFFLTGIDEPHAFLLLAPRAKHQKQTLYLAPRDPEAERWTGPREPLSPALKARYGVDQIRRGKPDKGFIALAQTGDCMAIIAPATTAKDDRPDALLSREVASALGLKLVFKRALLARMRETHGAEELALLEHAIRITRLGQEAAARAAVALVSEREVQTQLEYAFFSGGATGLSYSSIVGSGPNGAVLHWDRAQRRLQPGEVVVVDAGAEYGRYASDVTRTYPVSGKFSEEQARVYRAVYQAQEDVFAAIRPGASISDLQQAAEESLRKSGYLEYFIHGFGHFVGLDVHDVGDPEGPLLPGAIITVEPGVYMPERGFGVRLEDEVEITPRGYRLLTGDLPRKLEDVEAWVASLRRPSQR